MEGCGDVFRYMIAPTADGPPPPLPAGQHERVALAIRVFTLAAPVDPIAAVNVIEDVLAGGPAAVEKAREVSKHPIAFALTAFAHAKAMVRPATVPKDAEYLYATTPGGAAGHGIVATARDAIEVSEGVLTMVLGGELGETIAGVIVAVLVDQGLNRTHYSPETYVMLETLQNVAIELWTRWNTCTHADADAAPLAMTALFCALYMAHLINCPSMPMTWLPVPTCSSAPATLLVCDVLEYTFPNTQPVRESPTLAVIDDLYPFIQGAGRIYAAEYAEYVRQKDLPGAMLFLETEVPRDSDVFTEIGRVCHLPPAYKSVVDEMFIGGRICPWRFLQTEPPPFAQRAGLIRIDASEARWIRYTLPGDGALRAQLDRDIGAIGAAMPIMLRLGEDRFILDEHGVPCNPPDGAEGVPFASFVHTPDNRVVLRPGPFFKARE